LAHRVDATAAVSLREPLPYDPAMTAILRLWSDELEEARPETRAAVAAGIGMFSDRGTLAGLPREERVARRRAGMVASPLPEATERSIAGVRCRVFHPDGRPRAIYLHYHGGGMMSGSPEVMDVPNLRLARDHGVVVVSADYRKAPEHPYPAGPDDAFAVAAWLTEHAEEEFGIGRMVIGGESAGAYLTAHVALRLRDTTAAGLRPVAGLNLVFGSYDWGRTPSQRGLRPHEGPDVLDPEEIEFVTDCYLPGRTNDERRAADISPAFADLHRLPPLFMSVGTTDHLFDDTMLVATRAAAAGVEVELVVLPEMPHAFMAFPCTATKVWAERLDAWLERTLSSEPS
jgi:acetyl esterase